MLPFFAQKGHLPILSHVNSLKQLIMNLIARSQEVLDGIITLPHAQNLKHLYALI